MRYVVGSIFMETNADLDQSIRDLKKEIEALVCFIIIDVSLCVSVSLYLCPCSCLCLYLYIIIICVSVCLSETSGVVEVTNGCWEPNLTCCAIHTISTIPQQWEENWCTVLKITKTTQNKRMGMTISKHPVDVNDVAIEYHVVVDVVVDNEDYNIQTSRQPSLCSLEGATPFWWHPNIAPALCWWSWWWPWSRWWWPCS